MSAPAMERRASFYDFSPTPHPGSQVELKSGSVLTLFNDGLWHDTSGRAYAWEQIPSEFVHRIYLRSQP